MNTNSAFMQGQLQPQFDWGSLVGPIVTSVLSALSSTPQIGQGVRPQSAGPSFSPMSAGAGQLQPQFDWGSLVGPIIATTLAVLSAAPQISAGIQPNSTQIH
jgi:hypothetical protein